MGLCKVFKVKPQPETWNRFRPEHPLAVNMWRGWCHECGYCVAQYWDFGAALGATLYHLQLKHRRN